MLVWFVQRNVAVVEMRKQWHTRGNHKSNAARHAFVCFHVNRLHGVEIKPLGFPHGGRPALVKAIGILLLLFGQCQLRHCHFAMVGDIKIRRVCGLGNGRTNKSLFVGNEGFFMQWILWTRHGRHRGDYQWLFFNVVLVKIKNINAW